jgi:hypothetical protein
VTVRLRLVFQFQFKLFWSKHMSSTIKGAREDDCISPARRSRWKWAYNYPSSHLFSWLSPPAGVLFCVRLFLKHTSKYLQPFDSATTHTSPLYQCIVKLPAFPFALRPMMDYRLFMFQILLSAHAHRIYLG